MPHLPAGGEKNKASEAEKNPPESDQENPRLQSADAAPEPDIQDEYLVENVRPVFLGRTLSAGTNDGLAPSGKTQLPPIRANTLPASGAESNFSEPLIVKLPVTSGDHKTSFARNVIDDDVFSADTNSTSSTISALRNSFLND